MGQQDPDQLLAPTPPVSLAILGSRGLLVAWCNSRSCFPFLGWSRQAHPRQGTVWEADIRCVPQPKQRIRVMANRVTTLLPSGISNAVIGTALETYIAMDPSTVHQYFNDFDVYTSGDWTVTQTHAGTNAIAAGLGGILSLAALATSADVDQLTLKAATFAINAGLQTWFKARFSCADVTNSQIIFGLQNLNTNAFAASDGIWFEKDVAAVTMAAKVAASSTATTSTQTLTLVNSTYANVGFYYDGAAINLYFNDAPVGTVSATNIPLSTTNLALTIAVMNGTAAAQTLLVDYVLAAQERAVTTTTVG